MSDFPITPLYGGGYGGVEQNNIPFLPPYTGPYAQGDVAAQAGVGANYDTSMSAYGYNQSIPLFPAPSLAAGIPPLPIYQGWHPKPVTLPPQQTPQYSNSYQGYIQNTQSQQGSQFHPPVSQPNHSQSNVATRHFEHADLSEGEYEGAAATHTPINYNGSHWGRGATDGYPNASQRSFPHKTSKLRSFSNNGNDYASHQRNHSQVTRPDSTSYSPPGSTEVYKPNFPSQPKMHNNGKWKAQNGAGQNGTMTPEKDTQKNGWHKEQENATHGANSAIPPVGSQAPAAMGGKTISQMRKEAADVIRALFPLGVSYNTYMEEGFKEDIISNLFNDVRMPTSGATHVIVDKLQAGPTTRAPITENINGQINHSVSSTPIEGTSSAPPMPATAAVSANTMVMNEKQKTLQSKMEALRKSREERAQKSAAKNGVKAALAPMPAKSISSNPLITTGAHPVLPSQGAIVQPEDASIGQSSESRSVVTQLPIESENKDKPIEALPKPVTQSQTPLIPGLFLTSNAMSPSQAPAPASAQASHIARASPPAPPSTSQVPTGGQRKRPVASDFEEFTAPMTAIKRPFGHSRSEQTLIINVSEDESDEEDVAMDLESQADQDSPVQLERNLSDQRVASLQRTQLSPVPPQKPYTPPPKSIGTITPTRPQSSSKIPLPTPDVLQRKETEIQKLKKMIAEREAARARARQTPSGSRAQTPRTVEAEMDTSKGQPNFVNPTSSNTIETAIQVQKMMMVANEGVALDHERLVDVQAAESKKAAEVAKTEAEQKRLRRQKIASDLPIVDAEVQKGQLRLEQMRAEMAKIEADMRQKLDDQRKLSEEMAKLGQEADDQLQAQKAKLDDLDQEEARKSVDATDLPTLPSMDSVQPSPTFQEMSQLEPNSLIIGSVPTEMENVPTTEKEIAPFGTVPQTVSSPPATILVNDSNHVDEPPATIVTGNIDEDGDDSKDSMSTDRALEAQLQQAVQAQADRHGDEENVTGIEPLAPVLNPTMPETATSPSEEGQLSDDYTPIVDGAMPDISDRDSITSSHDSDGYEPPEATPPEYVAGSNSPPFSPAPPDHTPERSVDTMVVDSVQVADSSHQESHEQLRSRDEDVIPQPHKDEPHRPQTFTHYESPLKKFRAYRFHPDFKHEVTGGLRSLTYSHKIDSNIELCRYELAGGVCNDTTCASQHWHSLKLADDGIMAAIGCPDEFQGEQRDRFRESLREVLLGLRVRKVKDFDTISSEIIAHRAKFLGDPSRILAALEGTIL